MKDRFTEATAELSGKNPYICDSCTTEYGHPTVGHLADMHGRHEEHRGETWGAECLINCDPVPFGD